MNGLTLNSGQYAPLFTFNPKVNIRDIAHNLSNECRWHGSCAWHYSVAQHLVYCSKFCIYPYSALMHDIEEAFFKDISATVKHHPSIEEYTKQSKICRFKLFAEFNVTWDLKIAEEVKITDMKMLVTEAKQLMHPNWFINHKEMPTNFQPFDLQIERWTPEEAKYRFLKRFEELNAFKY